MLYDSTACDPPRHIALSHGPFFLPQQWAAYLGEVINVTCCDLNGNFDDAIADAPDAITDDTVTNAISDDSVTDVADAIPDDTVGAFLATPIYSSVAAVRAMEGAFRLGLPGEGRTLYPT